MRRNNKSTNGKRIRTISWMLMLALGAVVFSCNKPFPNTLKDDYGPESGAGTTQRALVIVVDGAVGTEIQAIRPPALLTLSDNAIYSYNNLADTRKTDVTNATGWTTLLTGVTAPKHGVVGTDFTGNNLADYPTIFTRLKETRPTWRTAAFCSSPELAANLTADASEKKSFAGDDALVKNAVISELKTQDTRFVMAQFHSVDVAGSAGEYSADDPGYRTAVMKVDQYIGEIVDSLKKRSSFESENWIVIVTSGKGSGVASDPVEADKLAYKDSRRNTFFICYNPKFKALYKPGLLYYSGTTPIYTGETSTGYRSTTASNVTDYNIGSTGDYTIECKVKINAGNYNYPPIFSKRAAFSSGTVGWCFFLEGDYWQINFGQAGFNNRQIRGHAVSDGKWHTLTVVIKQEGTARNVYTYTDGVLYPFTGNRSITDYGDLSSPAPLTVGQLASDNNGVRFRITDIKFFNTALPGAYIAGKYCGTALEEGDPFLPNLISYWPCRSVERKLNDASDYLLDLGPKHNDLKLSKTIPGDNFQEISPNICPTPDASTYKAVPNSVDVVSQVFIWMGMQPQANWSLDGNNWITSYINL